MDTTKFGITAEGNIACPHGREFYYNAKANAYTTFHCPLACSISNKTFKEITDHYLLGNTDVYISVGKHRPIAYIR